MLAQYIALSLQKRLSPIASEHVFRSAGVDAWSGQNASDHTLDILSKQYQTDARDHRSYRLNNNLVVWAETIYTMTPERVLQIGQRFPAASSKLKLLDDHILFEDPISGSYTSYLQLANLIETAVMKHLSHLEML